MKGKSPDPQQRTLFSEELRNFLNPQHLLYQLTQKIPWHELEEYFSIHYSNKGRPAKPVRLMVSLLLLKEMFNLSDESVVERWSENPYYQFLSGETVFQWKSPVHPTDLVYFRKRIGKEGFQKVLEIPVEMGLKKSYGKWT